MFTDESLLGNTLWVSKYDLGDLIKATDKRFDGQGSNFGTDFSLHHHAEMVLIPSTLLSDIKNNSLSLSLSGIEAVGMWS
jgi:hypothetical protein